MRKGPRPDRQRRLQDLPGWTWRARSSTKASGLAGRSSSITIRRETSNPVSDWLRVAHRLSVLHDKANKRDSIRSS